MTAVNRPPQSVTRRAELPVAQRFAVLWDAPADLLGTAATAPLLRRAIKEAAGRAALQGLTIARDGFSYGYPVPDCWQEAHGGQPLEAPTAVIDVLRPLLVGVAGSVVVRRLER